MPDQTPSLAITIVATESYQYALSAQARLIQANLSKADQPTHLILVTDKKPISKLLAMYSDLFGGTVTIHHSILDLKDGHPNYKENAQLVIAQLRTEAFCKARSLNVDRCWSLDSDVLPSANALKCLNQTLDFDEGYYGVAASPYPSQGGGGFLFGRGSLFKQIADDVYEDERDIPKELETKLVEHRQKLVPNEKPSEEWIETMKSLEDEAKHCRPKGNIFELNGKHWRKRGWGEAAYPAIGKGAIVPTDWVGMGNTLLSRKALQLADFTGYEGKGTEDLFLVWNRWYPNGIRCGAVPHCLSHHVIRNKNKDGYTLCYAYHETEGDMVGHIRLKHLPWYSHQAGEQVTAKTLATKPS